MTLHVTNGDSAAQLLREAGFGGTILPWRDVLHEGPVPAGPQLDELSELRARYLAARGWGTLDELRTSFFHRNTTLRNWGRYDGMLLWFEHDLYDQLQILQILDYLARNHVRGASLSMICIGNHPDVSDFRGLGDLTPEQILPLYDRRERITEGMLRLAREAWAAFRDADPRRVERLIAGNTTPLPFLGAALVRHLEQLPSTFNGLGRTEHHALVGIASGVTDSAQLFIAHEAQEEAPFVGDWSFWAALRDLAGGTHPLLQIHGDFPKATLTLSPDGADVVSGDRDAIALRGVRRWLGGIHLCGGSAEWRWDGDSKRVVHCHNQ